MVGGTGNVDGLGEQWGQSIHGPGCGMVSFTGPEVVPCSSRHIGRVHRLLDGSLQPVRIILFLKMTWHFLSSKTTVPVQPALHNTCTPRSDAIII
jgi:hypothetical protein